MKRDFFMTRYKPVYVQGLMSRARGFCAFVAVRVIVENLPYIILKAHSKY